jgi:soluble P-type ATPase
MNPQKCQKFNRTAQYVIRNIANILSLSLKHTRLRA